MLIIAPTPIPTPTPQPRDYLSMFVWFNYSSMPQLQQGPSLNQYRLIVNLTLNIQWNLNKSLKIFFGEYALQRAVRKMAAILLRSKCAEL